MTLYIDSSAAVKLLVRERESEQLRASLKLRSDDLVSTVLLETEVRRFAVRAQVPALASTRLLEAVTLYAMPRDLFRGAGALPQPTLRSLDALHVEAAARLAVDAVLTYDARMAEAATAAGIAVWSPGAD